VAAVTTTVATFSGARKPRPDRSARRALSDTRAAAVAYGCRAERRHDGDPIELLAHALGMVPDPFPPDASRR
jgi:hypothetical protein